MAEPATIDEHLLPLRRRSSVYFVLRALRAYLGHSRYREAEYHALPRFVRPGSVAVDCGANVGIYAFRLARLVCGSGHVFAIEPLPLHAGHMRVAARILHLPQLSVIEAAAGRESGLVSFTIPLLSDGVHVDDAQAHISAQSESPTFTVAVVTLDSIVAEVGRLDFLKIDVEGAEYDVLEGGRSAIQEYRPTIVLECQDVWARRYGRSAEDVFGLLRDMRYEAYKIVDRRLSAVQGPTRDGVNYVFLPEHTVGTFR